MLIISDAVAVPPRYANCSISSVFALFRPLAMAAVSPAVTPPSIITSYSPKTSISLAGSRYFVFFYSFLISTVLDFLSHINDLLRFDIQCPCALEIKFIFCPLDYAKDKLNNSPIKVNLALISLCCYVILKNRYSLPRFI